MRKTSFELMSHFAQVCERVILHFAELREDALVGREGERE